MTPISAGAMLRLLSNQTSTATALTNSVRVTPVSFRPIIPCARAYHRSALLQDKASSSSSSSSSPSPSTRTRQNKSRGSFFWRRRDRKETRNRISTLALDPNAVEAQEAERGSHHQSGSKDEGASRQSTSRLLSQTQRRVLLFTVVLSMPFIGRDVMELIVPGLLGTVILVGGKVKGAIKWVRRLGSE